MRRSMCLAFMVLAADSVAAALRPTQDGGTELVEGAAAEKKARVILWQEDFSRFDVGPAGGFGEKCVIREEDGRRYLHGTGWMMGKMAYFGSRRWEDYSFRLRFRFTDPKKIGFYPLVKDGDRRGGTKYAWYYVDIGRDSLSLRCHGLRPKKTAEKHKTQVFRYKDLGLKPLEARRWYAADIQVTDRRIRVFLGERGEKVRIADVEAIPGGGGVNILSYSPVDLADMVVERLPDQRKSNGSGVVPRRRYAATDG